MRTIGCYRVCVAQEKFQVQIRFVVAVGSSCDWSEVKLGFCVVTFQCVYLELDFVKGSNK